MLNEALSQYVDLLCSVGFKFRVQRLLLANFVRFAERHGDEFIRVARVIDGRSKHRRRLSAATVCSPRAASASHCRLRIHVMKYRRPMRSVAGYSSVEPRIYTRQEKLPP